MIFFFAKSAEGTPGVTGWFEVNVDGKLVHSKKVQILYNACFKAEFYNLYDMPNNSFPYRMEMAMLTAIAK